LFVLKSPVNLTKTLISFDPALTRPGNTVVLKIQLAPLPSRAVELRVARSLVLTELNGKIGATAWKVWVVLYNDGPQTLPQLKRKLYETSDLLNLSLGWLVREDKVEITRKTRGVQVQLRKPLLGPSQGLPGGQRNKPSRGERGRAARSMTSAA
jgi:winged helix-turn-helix protein DUF2582